MQAICICPLCEQISKEMQEKVAKSKGDSTQMYKGISKWRRKDDK